MNKIEAVLLDFDGTLLNTLPGWMKVIDKNLRKIESSQELSKPLPRTYQEIMQALATELMAIQEYGVAHNDALQFVESVIAGSIVEINRAELHRGMELLLQSLNRTGIKLGVVSSTKSSTITDNLKRLNISCYFSSVIGRDMVKRTKPHPEPVELCISELGVDPSKTIMVGDHESDVLAAHAASVIPFLFFPQSHEKFYDFQSMLTVNAILVRNASEVIDFLS